LDYVDEVRRNQPVFEHRRSDLYSLYFNEKREINGIFFKSAYYLRSNRASFPIDVQKEHFLNIQWEMPTLYSRISYLIVAKYLELVKWYFL